MINEEIINDSPRIRYLIRAFVLVISFLILNLAFIANLFPATPAAY